MGDLEGQLLNTNVVLMAAAAWFIMWVLRKIIPQMQTNVWVKRFKPLYPALICQGLVWIPGALPDDSSIGSKILMGFWCGFLASIGYQLIRRFLGSKGIDLPDDPNNLVPTTPPPQEAPKEEEDEEVKKAKMREQADTPIETPIPKGDTPSDGEDEGGGNDEEGEDGDGDEDEKPDGAA